jgi:hypothetical protein
VEAELAEGHERPARVLANVCSYEEMLTALRARVTELQISGERFDEYAGLPRGYLSKLVGVNPVRKLGMTSFAPVLAGLGLRLLVIEDPDATDRLKNSLPPRNGSYVRAAPRIMLTERVWRQLQKRGRQVRWSKLTPAQRRQIMRALALKRWRGP